MRVGSGVRVAGAGVEVASPAGTVVVGTGVSVIVDVGIGVHIVVLVGGVVCGARWLITSVISVTMTVPHTPITAAMIDGSILDLRGSDMVLPIH